MSLSAPGFECFLGGERELERCFAMAETSGLGDRVRRRIFERYDGLPVEGPGERVAGTFL